MSNTDDLLIELGTEELPPKALQKLASSFAMKGEALTRCSPWPKSSQIASNGHVIAA